VDKIPRPEDILKKLQSPNYVKPTLKPFMPIWTSNESNGFFNLFTSLGSGFFILVLIILIKYACKFARKGRGQQMFATVPTAHTSV